VSEKYDYTYTAHDYEDAQEFELRTIWEPDQVEEVAEEAAEDYFHNHDGWESSWPRPITIFRDGKKLRTVSVDMEAVPKFFAVIS
jgi:hypothetical protein